MTARLAMALGLLGSTVGMGCAAMASDPAPGPATVDEVPVREAGSNQDSATAPIPFTARQIHDAMPVGREIRWTITVDGQEQTRLWRVRGQTDDALTLQSGPPEGPFQRATTPWTELRMHAAFPAADTTIEKGVALESPLSDTPLSTTRYVVRRTGEDGSPEVHTFWFAPEHPGPPVRNTIEREGAVAFEMWQVERTRVDPTSWPPEATAP